MENEIRVTIELLTADGTVLLDRIVLAEPDSASLLGDVEAELDDILAELDDDE